MIRDELPALIAIGAGIALIVFIVLQILVAVLT